jgi:hypothetical protein
MPTMDFEPRARELIAREAPTTDNPYAWREWASNLTWIVRIYVVPLIALLDARIATLTVERDEEIDVYTKESAAMRAEWLRLIAERDAMKAQEAALREALGDVWRGEADASHIESVLSVTAAVAAAHDARIRAERDAEIAAKVRALQGRLSTSLIYRADVLAIVEPK